MARSISKKRISKAPPISSVLTLSPLDLFDEFRSPCYYIEDEPLNMIMD